MRLCEKHPKLKGRRHRSGRCAGCAIESAAAWRAANPEKVKAASRRYWKKNRDKLRRKSAAWHRANRKKALATMKEWRRKNPERYKAISLRRVGFTPELLKAALIAQRHRCAICRRDLKGMPTWHAHADHCHRTGKARGVLCHSCNTGIGKFKDSAEVLMRAVRYLRKPTLARRA